MSATTLTADGAAKVAAMLTDTIAREQLRHTTPDDIRAFVLRTFRTCLDELMSNGTEAAMLEQITSSHNMPAG